MDRKPVLVSYVALSCHFDIKIEMLFSPVLVLSYWFRFPFEFNGMELVLIVMALGLIVHFVHSATQTKFLIQCRMENRLGNRGILGWYDDINSDCFRERKF